MREEAKIAIYEVSIDNAEDITSIDLENVYTWQNDRQPILLIRKIVKLLTYILQSEWLKQENHQQLNKVPTLGHILWALPYDPPFKCDLLDDLDIQDAPVVCNACAR